MPWPADLPNPIRAARKAAGYATCAEAARALGMEQAHLARLELGGRGASWATVRRLILTLDLELEWFFPEHTITRAADRVRRRRRKGTRSCG